MNLDDVVKQHPWKSAGVTLVVALVVGLMWLVFGMKVAPVSWGFLGPVYTTEGVAILGYDPLAYYVLGEPRVGHTEDSHHWQGAEWRFDSVGGLARFQVNPEKFAPRYGGYCAFAVSNGFTAWSDPEVWHIEDNRLYLFVDEGAKQSWLAELDRGVIDRCDANWARR